MRKYRHRSLCFSMIVFILVNLIPSVDTFAKTDGNTKNPSTYGVLIGDKKGDYTFYNLNGIKKEQKIEVLTKDNIMVPLKLLCSYMKDIKYSFDFNTRKAVLINQATGKKLILTENQKTAYSYAKGSNKGIKHTMASPMYLSKDSNAAMAPMSSLKWILGKEEGYQYFKKSAIQKAGYNGASLEGIIVYNPYNQVTALPNPVKISYEADKKESNIVKVTIPEGYSVALVFELLAENDVCASSDVLFQACNQYDFSKYSLINKMDKEKNRCFRLEGYLYPDTYHFYRYSKGEDILGTFLRNSEKKITEDDQATAEEMGYTMDQVIRIASIIEKETGKKSEMGIISSVLYNRLKSGMKLQCDATIHYVEKYIKPYIKGDINRYNEFYNTYKCKGLPSGAICNPGKNAMNAALHPEQTDYLYFVTDQDGNYHYGATWEEHVKNLELYTR